MNITRETCKPHVQPFLTTLIVYKCFYYLVLEKKPFTCHLSTLNASMIYMYTKCSGSMVNSIMNHINLTKLKLDCKNNFINTKSISSRVIADINL